MELSKALRRIFQFFFFFGRISVKLLVDELGFAINKSDKCVANKMIDGKQCTVLWHVGDLKLSRAVRHNALEGIVEKLQAWYGKETP